MSSSVEARLKELNIELPKAAAAAAAYVPYVVSGKLLFISGQLPVWNGTLRHTGKVGSEIPLDEGKAAARLCGLNILAQAREACGGSLDRIKRCVKLGGFVASAPDFHDHHKVVNGTSELMQEVFGDAGMHARFAVGAPALPLNVPVEVEAVFELA